MPKIRNYLADAVIQPEPAQTAPPGWVKSLERSKAQVAAGQTVPLEPALDKLRASIARMEAKRVEAAKK